MLTLLEPSRENVLRAAPNLYSMFEENELDSVMNINPLMTRPSPGSDWWQQAIRLQQARNVMGMGLRNVVVGSAGNVFEGRVHDVEDLYPAVKYHRPRNLIIVGASNTQNDIYRTSNFGRNTVDIFVPGEEIRAVGQTTAFRQTSASAPMVAGVAALMLSANPNLNPTEIREIINYTANRNVSQFIRDNSIAGGILDAYAAIRRIVQFNQTPANTISSPFFLTNQRTIINHNPFIVNLVIEYDMSGDGDTIRYFLRTNLLSGHGFTINDSYFNNWNHSSGFRIWFESNGKMSNSIWWS